MPRQKRYRIEIYGKFYSMTESDWNRWLTDLTNNVKIAQTNFDEYFKPTGKPYGYLIHIVPMPSVLSTTKIKDLTTYEFRK